MGESLPAQPGDILNNYRLEHVLGQGGMGCVYQATHIKLGRKVALKLLSNSLAASDEYVSRFLHEAKIVNDVRHPNIVDITNFIDIESPKRVAYVMEFISGPSLGDVLKNQRLTVPQAINIMFQLISALEAVHALQVVHRDLKPDNILLLAPLDSDFSQVPSVKILDFGIAKVSDSGGGHKTATGLMLGTPAYMAPEQIAAEPVSWATDVYALGEILYEMIAGERVFGGDQMSILKTKLIGEVFELELPEGTQGRDELTTLIQKTLSLQPESRPDLKTLASELTDILAKQKTWIEPNRIGPIEKSSLAPNDATPVNMVSVANLPTIARQEPRASASKGILLAVVAAVGLAGFGLWTFTNTPKGAPITQPTQAQKPPSPKTPPAPPPVPAVPKEAPEPAKEVQAKKPAAKSRRSKMRTISVHSIPAGAVVFDATKGTRLGRAPVRIRMKIGQLKNLRLELPGHLPARLKLGTDQARVSIALAPKSSLAPAKPKPKPKTKRKIPIKRRELAPW